MDQRFNLTKRGRLMKRVRPKSLRKLRESIQPRTNTSSGRRMAALVVGHGDLHAGLFRLIPGLVGGGQRQRVDSVGELGGASEQRVGRRPACGDVVGLHDVAIDGPDDLRGIFIKVRDTCGVGDGFNQRRR